MPDKSHKSDETETLSGTAFEEDRLDGLDRLDINRTDTVSEAAFEEDMRDALDKIHTQTLLGAVYEEDDPVRINRGQTKKRKDRIGDSLVSKGLIKRNALENAIADYKREKKPGDEHLRVGEILVHKNIIDKDKFAEFLAGYAELKYIDNLEHRQISITIVGMISHAEAREHNAITFAEDEMIVSVAISDPFNIRTLEAIRAAVLNKTGKAVVFYVSPKDSVEAAINHYYADIDAKEAADWASLRADEFKPEDTVFIADDSTDDSPIVSFLDKMLAYGYSRQVSDIHIEPFRNRTVVRIRIDGGLREYTTLNERTHRALIARIKILSNLDISERRLPQDGHFDYHDKTTREMLFSVRVSVCPCVFGEKAVLRYLNVKTNIVFDETLGMSHENYIKVKRMLDSPYGIIYVTGATGSGKTTTLYKMLDYLSAAENRKNISIASIEDPVEKNIDRVSQMQVNLKAGLTFETGLRAILRQDPDVFMVGETRDKETASTSVRAAITGHLVLSSLHTNDAASSITRLIDMEIPRYMLSASLIGIVAQRLVRMVCTNCAVTVPIERYRAENTQDLSFLPSDIKVVRMGTGCPMCNFIGYKGRQAVHEILIIDNKIRRMINDPNILSGDIKEYCRRELGMATLEDWVISLIRNGITTPEEYIRVISTL